MEGWGGDRDDQGASAPQTGLAGAEAPEPDKPSRPSAASHSADILPPRRCDDEVAGIMDELSKLQTLLTLQMRQGPVWIAAADLVQRTRVLIVERCYTSGSSR